MHSKSLPLVAFLILMATETLAVAQPTEPSIIPRPASLTVAAGVFHLNGDAEIVTKHSARPVGEYLADLLRPTLNLRLVEGQSQAPTQLIIQVDPAANTGAEGYSLQISPQRVQIRATTAAGAFYGVQTLRQLCPAEIDSKSAQHSDGWDIPCLQIDDRPQYQWRGMMLDVCRHFRDVAYVKRFIDLMALHKLNTLHWHLTDDQGWRIEIKKYPKLTVVGAWRDDGHGGKYGGFYTQDEIRDVVAYAAARHITIVPEIEMPGHSTAAVTAYPELACTDGPFAVATTWGVFKDIYDPAKPHTFEFLEDVLTEVMDLFPGQFIHIGGDEVPKDRWKADPDCQALMKREGLKNEDELQSYFVRKIDAFITSKGRRMIGWDEILEGGLAPGAAVMSWRGIDGGVAAAKSGHDVVMTPMDFVYFDHYQSQGPDRPKAIGGYTPIEKVYSFQPTPPALSAQEAAHVLGSQANLWSEYFDSDRQNDYMAFPRECALAEVLWTPPDRHDYNDFSRRLPAMLARLDQFKVQYFRATP
jgi:hexosaminidase